MKKICLLVYSLGGGHRSAASALQAAIQQRQLPWHIEIVDAFDDIIGASLPGYIYNNFILHKKWARVINEFFLFPLFKLRVQIGGRFLWGRRMRNYLHQQQPDLVVSAIAMLNKVIFDTGHTTPNPLCHDNAGFC
jgi:UDP-N-acetylglucosamine:LPS N-acetylglucosamine transferase